MYQPRRAVIGIQGEDRPPPIVMTVPLADTEMPMAATLVIEERDEHELWFLLALSDSRPLSLARMLALPIINRSESIVLPEVMPVGSARVTFLKDGSVRRGRGFFLAPWILQEMDRLAAELMATQEEYFLDMSRALKQLSSTRFRVPPPGFLFASHLESARISEPPEFPHVNTADSDRVRLCLNWHQLVGLDYTRNRYLLHASEGDLADRLQAILANVHHIDSKGLISLDPKDARLHFWLRLLKEVQVEMSMRHGPYPAGWKKGMVDLEQLPHSLRAAGSHAAVELKPKSDLKGPYLVKYGQQKHLAPMLERGLVRIAPASSYGDASLNPARRDDEMAAEVKYDPFAPFNDAPPGTVILPNGRVPFRRDAKTNYYVLCLAETLNRRLLFDFEADSALVIFDPDRFVDLLIRKARRELPGWRAEFVRVDYFDPFTLNPWELAIGKTKNFRFAYQEEVRIVWWPPTTVKTLTPRFVRLGNLSDVAELVSPVVLPLDQERNV